MANPDIRIPSRETLTERLQELAIISHSELIAKLPPSGKISLALDCWTSPDYKPFLAITAYFIDESFKFQEMLLGFRPIEGEHTGRHLADLVLSVLSLHNLQSRVLAITTDNASNNGTMMQALETQLQQGLGLIQQTTFNPKLVDVLHRYTQSTSHSTRQLVDNIQHIPCLAHVLQLTVKAFLTQLNIESQDDQITKTWSKDDHQLCSPPGLKQSLKKV
jgi:hypothetical protein